MFGHGGRVDWLNDDIFNFNVEQGDKDMSGARQPEKPKSIFEFICKYKPSKEDKNKEPSIQELEDIYAVNPDLSETNGWGQSIADIACNHRFPIALEWLRSKGAHLKQISLEMAVHYNDEKMVKTIVDSKANVNARKEHKETHPLHRAVTNDNYNILKLLLEAKANPDVRNASEETPLHIAAKKADIISYQLLEKHGANDNLEDNCKKIPPAIFIEASEKAIEQAQKDSLELRKNIYELERLRMGR